MPRLLRFIIMNAADSPAIAGGKKRLESSPPSIFSTLMTLAPISASISPQTGPRHDMRELDDLEPGERAV